MSGGFDDQFNDGVFRSSFLNNRNARPDMFPLSVSEMRRHTNFDKQGVDCVDCKSETAGMNSGNTDSEMSQRAVRRNAAQEKNAVPGFMRGGMVEATSYRPQYNTPGNIWKWTDSAK